MGGRIATAASPARLRGFDADGAGTPLTWEHTGFTGVGGFLVSRVLARARKKMLERGLPRVLDAISTQAAG